MKLTIIPEDNSVYIDGVCINSLTWTDTPDNVHALQWNNDIGWIEFNDGNKNQIITDIPIWAQNAIDAWTNANTSITQQPLSEEELLIQSFEIIRIAIQTVIDEKAKSFGFSSGNALMLYAGFTNEFQSLALTFASWEANIWVEAEAYRVQVIAGTKPMLSPEQVVSMIPNYPS